MAYRIAVLASGRGSNLQAIIDAIAGGRLEAELAGVFSDRPRALALERARHLGVPALAIRPGDFNSRADADHPNMGLQTWPKDNIRKQDALVSKNYLADGEIRELNRLTTILLDIFEDQLDIGRLVVMSDARQLLDQQLANLNRAVLRHGGQVKMEDAKARAEREYERFDAARKLQRHDDADALIKRLKDEEKSLPARPRKKS